MKFDFMNLFSRNQEVSQTKAHLIEILDKEINNLKSAIHEAYDSDARSELQRVRIALRVRRALVDFEAEEVVNRRMNRRQAFGGLIFSVPSLIISILAIWISFHAT